MFYILRFNCCLNSEQPEGGISALFRRAPALIGGFLLHVWQSLLLIVSSYGGTLEGSRMACRYLNSGYSTPDSVPRPSSGIDDGISKIIQEASMPRNIIVRTIGITPAVPHLYRPLKVICSWPISL